MLSTPAAATGVLLFAGTAPVNALVSAIAVGDLITLVSVTGPVFKVVCVLTATTCVVSPVNVANVDVAASAIIDDLAPADPRCGFNNIQMIFQPSIGIMNHSQPLSGGDFRFDLNPNPNYAIAGIQSNYALQSGVDYNLTSINVLVYVCQI
jgi:hypothetical protein